ncbi:MAG: hypothetical protein U1C33_00550 [Candidatus Cloacimonadaceae bacterium]|nr:hypothetical protein [Candidatus Cloacimonadaceae bacterium]
MKADNFSALRISYAALIVIIGTILSGPFGVLLVKAIGPQTVYTSALRALISGGQSSTMPVLWTIINMQKPLVCVISEICA